MNIKYKRFGKGKYGEYIFLVTLSQINSVKL